MKKSVIEAVIEDARLKVITTKAFSDTTDMICIGLHDWSEQDIFDMGYAGTFLPTDEVDAVVLDLLITGMQKTLNDTLL